MQVKREKLERVCRSVALAVHTGPLRGQPGWGHQTEGKQNCAGPFAVVSGRRNGRGRVSRARLAGLDHLWALGHRGCPWFSGIWLAD